VPTYSYECTECGDRFDIVQAFTDDALTTCERCSGRLRKRFNSVGVVFKGSGFYRTDSRESAGKAKSSAPGAADSSSGDSGSASGSGDKSGSAEKSGSSEKSGSNEKSGSADKSTGTSKTSTTSTTSTTS
jgi:putative FmdB family regulatory protein